MSVVEVTYRGIKVVRGRLEPAEGCIGFVQYEAPLPVGTRVVVHVEGEAPRAALVAGVVEQEAGAKSPPGMRLRWVAAVTDEANQTQPSAPPVPSPVDQAEPVLEMDAEPPDGRTIQMPAVTGEFLLGDATVPSMPAVTDEIPPEPSGGFDTGGKKKRTRRKKGG